MTPVTPTETPSANPTTANPTRAPLPDEQTHQPSSSPTQDPTTASPTTSTPTTSPTAEPTTAYPTDDPTTILPTYNPTTPTPTAMPTITVIPASLIGVNIVSSRSRDITISVTINTETDTVDIVLIGPSDRWFGVGFGQSSMQGYAIVASGATSVVEYRLVRGSQNIELSSMITIDSDMVDGGGRSISMRRARVGTGDHYTFPNSPGTIDIIWAFSSGGSTTFGYHGNSDTGARGGMY